MASSSPPPRPRLGKVLHLPKSRFFVLRHSSGPSLARTSKPAMLAVCACAMLLSAAFVPTPSRLGSSSLPSSSASSIGVAMQAKGFGKPTAKEEKEKAKAEKPKSAVAAKRDKAAETFEKLKAGGAPEYMVLIRTVDSTSQPSKWYPVGGIAVPRSSSEDQALSLAIFNNEDELLKGAFRSYPFLRNTNDKFEYGYRCAATTCAAQAVLPPPHSVPR